MAEKKTKIVTDDLTEENIRKNRLWKQYETKDDFEKFYASSPMLRYLYCNEKNPDGTYCDIYVEIAGTKKVVYWISDGVDDAFVYRSPSFDELMGAK